MNRPPEHDQIVELLEKAETAEGAVRPADAHMRAPWGSAP